ncbi:hypothetical protein [Nocardia grenadensis]
MGTGASSARRITVEPCSTNSGDIDYALVEESLQLVALAAG